MKLYFGQSWKSIQASGAILELDDFVVLSGANGAGKTHLLEAIARGAVGVSNAEEMSAAPHPTLPTTDIRFFGLAQLAIADDEVQTASSFANRWKDICRVIESTRAQMHTAQGVREGSKEFDAALRDALVGSRVMSSVQVEMMLTRAGKRISELSETDIRSNAPLIAGVRDPFGLRISEIFLTYYALREQNHYLNWRKESGRSVEGVVLTDQQFLNCYGPAPWEVMNDALKASGLNYEVTPVVGDTADVTYEPKLVSSSTGTAVTLANLSSGERVLMAIAMSIYLSENLTDAIRMPQVLLLDEADASLHPTMVGNLLRVIGEVFCARFGIKVILTTHSATTVALAPPESIYVMRKTGEPRIRKATRDEVLRELAIGVPTLSVRVEDRIQVFVESEHDQACYAELFRLLRQRLDSPFSLEFIASGKLNRGDSNAVRHLVSKLREGGTTRYGAS